MTKTEQIVTDHPQRGWHWVAPQRGAVHVREGPVGAVCPRLLQIQISLTAFQLLLLADVLANLGFIQTYRADAVPG